MIVEDTMLDTPEYTVQYELLRSEVVGTTWDVAGANTAGRPRGVGLALLLSEGMPGWLTAVEAVFRASLLPRPADSPGPAPYKSSAGCSAAPVWLPNIHRHEVTALLASLVLSTRPFAR